MNVKLIVQGSTNIHGVRSNCLRHANGEYGLFIENPYQPSPVVYVMRPVKDLCTKTTRSGA